LNTESGQRRAAPTDLSGRSQRLACADFRVPPVVDRPLDVDEGEKVPVKRFELRGLVDRPEFDLKVADVEALLNERLAARPEGFSLGRLQEVAQAVTQMLRSKGLILAQAFVPVQTVAEGVVVIEVLEGKLGRVLTEGNAYYRTDQFERPFKGLVGEPVTQAGIEEAVLRLTDYPGLSVFGIFQPGQQVGTADMVLKVQEEDPLDFEVRYDNHGVRETGERRARLDASWNNPTKSGDRLNFATQRSHIGSNSYFYGGSYDRILWRDLHIEAGYNQNDFQVGAGLQSRDIRSETWNGYAALHQRFIRSRTLNLGGRLEFTRKHAKTTVRGRDQSLDELGVLLLEANFDSVDARWAGLNAGYIQYSHGFADFLGSMGENETRPRVPPSRQGGSRTFAGAGFDKFFFNYTRLQSLSPLGNFWGNKSMLFRMEGQWSNDLLVPLEQYAMGGPNNVRGYRPTEALTDKAVFMSFEYIVAAPGFADKEGIDGKTWGELLQVALFYDLAWGSRNDPLTSEFKDILLDAYGLSVQFNNPDSFATKLAIGFPIDDPEPINAREPQYWLDLNFSF
jgi:hemolysin activation/secretion protein